MRKILLLSIAFSLAGISFAQKTTPGGLYIPSVSGENNTSMVVPKEYAYNNKPLLTFTERANPSHIMVYDENIELIKSFDIDNEKVFTYSLTYQKESRDVTNVSEVDLNKQDLNKSFTEWLNQEKLYEKLYDSSLYDSSIEQALIITKQENGDSIISVDYSKLSNSYTSNSNMYFGYNYFGLKYPMLYWIASKGAIAQCRTSYTITYSEWKPTGETEQENYSERLRHIPLYNLNLDNGAGTNVTNGTYFEISQTLFNQDDDFEYIIPKLDLVKSDDSSTLTSYYTTVDNIETTRSTLISEKSQLGMVGFQVVSSSGNVVKDITFDNGFYATYESYTRYALITIGGNRYLTFTNGNETVFYKVDTQSTDIKKVKTAKGSMFLQPTIADKNSTINVTLGDDNENGSDIMITSMSGMKISSVNIPAGQTATQMSINAPSGMYCVSRIQNGKINETKKVIVK